ncbi:hypothetical protein GH714_038266 [Hevea brasiliensis]|uniref:Pectate lyase n=1 Tax=Hevea brasiliensis TaxID=3981 RepID=A0A6A6LHL3_HEVBR|nr:hypothetical protein GH714_038266 [Hevea brasiliensis]
MVIRLNQELMITSDKTIDARGAQVHIAGGAGLTLQFVKNVIIHGIRIHDIVVGTGGMIRDSVDHYGFRTKSDGDGISIFGSTNIWIDHVMLFGASDGYSGDNLMQITVAFNHFGKGLVQRMPRCRWGFVHVVNNDYTHWLMYAIGGSKNPTIISQGNRFIAQDNKSSKEVTKREYAMESEWKDWNWRSEGDLMMNGAFFVESGKSLGHQQFTRLQMIQAKPGTFVTRLTRYSGPLACHEGKPC